MFCRCRDDPATEQTPIYPLCIPLDSTEAIAHEKTLRVWSEAFAGCGQEPEDFEDIAEARCSSIRTPNQAAP